MDLLSQLSCQKLVISVGIPIVPIASDPYPALTHNMCTRPGLWAGYGYTRGYGYTHTALFDTIEDWCRTSLQKLSHSAQDSSNHMEEDDAKPKVVVDNNDVIAS